MEDNINSKDFIIGSLIGGMVGATIALLFAPKSGRELRGNINQGASLAVDRASDLKDNAKEKGSELKGIAKEKGSELKDKAYDRGSEFKKKAINTTSNFTKNVSQKTQDLTKTVQGKLAEKKSNI